MSTDVVDDYLYEVAQALRAGLGMRSPRSHELAEKADAIRKAIAAPAEEMHVSKDLADARKASTPGAPPPAVVLNPHGNGSTAGGGSAAGETVRREDVVRWLALQSKRMDVIASELASAGDERHERASYASGALLSASVQLRDGSWLRDLAALDPHAYVNDGKKRCEVCGSSEFDGPHAVPDSAGDAGTGET
jgi:hypothetical protein